MIAFFGAMIMLAAIPGVSVMAVAARSASMGFRHGAATTAGIVVGDLIFILVAVFGLALLVEALGDGVFLLKYIAGAYLIWLGIQLWRSNTNEIRRTVAAPASLRSSFMAGLLLTLADQKAILFYLAFFPAFFDASALSWVDVCLVAVLAIVAVGGVKLGYAYAASRAGAMLGGGVAARLNRLAAGVLILAGVWVAVRA